MSNHRWIKEEEVRQSAVVLATLAAIALRAQATDSSVADLHFRNLAEALDQFYALHDHLSDPRLAA